MDSQQPIKIYLKTTGCAINKAYSEYLAGLLQEEGYVLVDSPSQADLVIVNGCVIKKASEDRIIEFIRDVKRRNIPVIATGCLAQAVHKRVKKTFPDISLIGSYHIFRIPELIPAILQGKRIEIRSVKDFDPFYKPRILKNPFIGIVPIARGCLGECTFCIDRLIWGRLKSYPLDKIVEEIRRLISMGVKEIRLSGQDTGPYGWDIGIDLGYLLQKISEIEGDFRIRIGMASPDTLSRVIDGVLDVMKTDRRFYKYLHIPVQSGSNRILTLMKRKYTVEEFIDLISKIRNVMGSEITIATDIIVAFPTETEEDHQATLELLQKIRPDIVNISRYGDRPGVPATKLKPKVHSKIAKRRSKEVAELVMKNSLEKNQRYLNNELDVLFLERDNKRILGRTNNYRLVSVEVENPIYYLGKTVKTKIFDATWKTLYGKIMS